MNRETLDDDRSCGRTVVVLSPCAQSASRHNEVRGEATKVVYRADRVKPEQQESSRDIGGHRRHKYTLEYTINVHVDSCVSK